MAIVKSLFQYLKGQPKLSQASFRICPSMNDGASDFFITRYGESRGIMHEGTYLFLSVYDTPVSH